MAAATIRGVEDDGEAGGCQDEDDAATLDVELVLPGRVLEAFTPPTLSLQSLAQLNTISPFTELRFTVASPSLPSLATPTSPSSRWPSLGLLNGASSSMDVVEPALKANGV